MIFILTFIFGIIFIAFLYPIGDSLVGLLTTFLELVKGKITLKIAEYNSQIEKLAAEQEIVTPIVGFAIPNIEEEEDDEKKTQASMLFSRKSFDSALMKKINKHNKKPLKNKATRKNGERSAKEIINRLDTIKKFI